MEARIGVVIRDLLASVKLTASKTIFNALNAEEMKALACKDDIGLAGEWFQEPIIMESDCAAAVQYLKEVKVLKPACEHVSIIQEASHAASRLLGFELNHVKREI